MSLPPGRKPHVLVVDDSAVIRQTVLQIGNVSGALTIDVASDPLIAERKIAVRRPDAILLDLEMPRMDGLTFLQRMLARDPIPVVICSSLAPAGSENAIRALELGALAIVEKPRIGLKDFLSENARELIDTLSAAAGAHVSRRPARPAPQARRPVQAPPLLRRTTDRVIAVGASTGGTEAIRVLLTAMPPDAPGIVIVQHMPPGFTRSFAQRMNELCAIEVREAAAGDRIREGRALIAPGDRHLRVGRSGGQYIALLDDGPPVNRHKPSVDVLFDSVAAAAGPNATGVLLTGMGDDGASGLLAMRHAGAGTIAQDEATSVVFGMPKEAIKRGAAMRVLSLEAIPPAMLMFASGMRS